MSGYRTNKAKQGTVLIQILGIIIFALVIITPLKLIFYANANVIFANPTSVIVTPGQGVDFEQVDFEFSGFAQTDSNWGRYWVANPKALSSKRGGKKVGF